MFLESEFIDSDRNIPITYELCVHSLALQRIQSYQFHTTVFDNINMMYLEIHMICSSGMLSKLWSQNTHSVNLITKLWRSHTIQLHFRCFRVTYFTKKKKQFPKHLLLLTRWSSSVYRCPLSLLINDSITFNLSHFLFLHMSRRYMVECISDVCVLVPHM